MEGVEILNVIPEYREITGGNIAGFIIIALCLFGFFISLAFDYNNDAEGLIAGITFAIILIPTIIGIALMCDTSIYPVQYEITLSDDVNYNEFVKQYEVIEQRGKILVVKERKNYKEANQNGKE